MIDWADILILELGGVDECLRLDVGDCDVEVRIDELWSVAGHAQEGVVDVATFIIMFV